MEEVGEIVSNNKFFDPVEIQNFMQKVIKKDSDKKLLKLKTPETEFEDYVVSVSDRQLLTPYVVEKPICKARESVLSSKILELKSIR